MVNIGWMLAATAVVSQLPHAVVARGLPDKGVTPFHLTSFNPAFIKPDDQVEILSTLANVRTLTAKYNGRVRSEVVNDRHIVIDHDNTAHVATLAGEALDYAQRALSLGPYGPYAPNGTAELPEVTVDLSPPPTKRVRPSATPAEPATKTFKSPFQLTRIRDLPQALNEDTVTLNDLLGDPLISECWNFNYLHDIPFLMAAFDEDVRSLVKVHVVHGFWKRDDLNRQQLEKDVSSFKNVSLHDAYMPEMFGTHHSKMLLLLRHDDTAQVVIHTANIIPRDWTNMTQAVWRSPLLPLLPGSRTDRGDGHAATGSGAKFKADLLNYLGVYESRRRRLCRPIMDALSRHDFSAVKGALIASVPGRHNVLDDSPSKWGWKALQDALRAVPTRDQDGSAAEIVVQVSSIATLGPTSTWLRETFFRALGASPKSHPAATAQQAPSFKVVFPTADEIRRSLDGYAAGGSIHTKTQSAQQAKQLAYLHPHLCHWANDSGAAAADLPRDEAVRNGGRQRAAPHVKTYMRYSGSGTTTLDWALVTSANLSKQAWGEAASSATGEMRVASYEIGVLVWPALYDDGAGAVMVPTFCTDEPVADDAGAAGARRKGAVVGVRVPYSLPLRPYGPAETPWVATARYSEPDWMGRMWEAWG